MSLKMVSIMLVISVLLSIILILVLGDSITTFKAVIMLEFTDRGIVKLDYKNENSFLVKKDDDISEICLDKLFVRFIYLNERRRRVAFCRINGLGFNF